MLEDVIQMLNEGKKSGRIQKQIIKGILSLSQTKKEELLTQYYVVLSQCIDKNVELISSIRTFSLYPELLSSLQPYTGYTIEELEYLSGLSEKLPHSVPNTPKEIIAVDLKLRYLLCPVNRGDKKFHEHLESLPKGLLIETHDGQCDATKLRQVLLEKERLIRALRAQILKIKTQVPDIRELEF